LGEASESLHVWRATHGQTREFLLAAGVFGRIVASNERWTTFVPSENDEITKSVSLLPGLTLHWIYFEDFGLGLNFWENSKELGRAEFRWEAGLELSIAPSLLESLRARRVLDSFERLHELARDVVAGVCLPRDVRDGAAAMLGVPAYAWMSPGYGRDTSIDEIRRLFPRAEELERPDQ
jgi:hypothetical protein